MDIGILVVWLSLFIYIIVLFKNKIIDKKERKWVYMLVGLVMGLSLLAAFNVSLNMVISALNNSFGKLSRLVVNI
jgi:hypothetical protein